MWRLIFVLSATLWALALPLASWAASRPDPPLPISIFAIAVYGLGSLVCHQLPARSFHLWATQLPVCARCTGIYAGGALSAIISIVGRDTHRKAIAPRSLTSVILHPLRDPHPTFTSARGGPPPLASLARSRSLVYPASFAAAALPTIATLTYEWIGSSTPAGWVRALAGVPLGVAVAWLVVRGDEVN